MAAKASGPRISLSHEMIWGEEGDTNVVMNGKENKDARHYEALSIS